MATQDFKALDEVTTQKHPTCRINLEVFRTAMKEAKEDVKLAREQMIAFSSVLKAAELRFQWAEAGYENALDNQHKRRMNKRFVKKIKPVEKPVIQPPAEPPRCNGSMISFMLGC